MAFSSTFSLHSNTLTTPNLLFSLKTLSLNNAQKNKPLKSLKKTKPIILNTSDPPKKITHLPKEEKNPNPQRILVEKAVGFIVGSVLFVGCLGLARKPVTANIQNNPEKVEEERVEEEEEKEEEKEEEEILHEKLLESEPENVEALKVVLHGKMRRGKFKEAVKFVERLGVLEPEEIEWKLLMALCRELMGQLSEAKRLFKEVLKERPLMLRALHGLALVMHKNKEGQAVFVMLYRALKIARSEKRVTEERNIKILIAQMHIVRGELEDGLKEFQALVDEDYRDFRPYLCLGIIYSLQNKKKEAAEQFEMYRSLVPEEFPQRNFLDDVVMAAKTKSQDQLRQQFENEYAASK